MNSLPMFTMKMKHSNNGQTYNTTTRAKLGRSEVMSSYKRFSLAVCIGLSVLVLGGCKPEGPAERAGKEIDKTAERLGEVIEKKGPAERAGEKVDEAVKDAGEALE